jgi:hypothetical protein
MFRAFGLAKRRPALVHAVMAPLICWSFSSSLLRYLLVDHAVPGMWRSLGLGWSLRSESAVEQGSHYE